MAAPLQVVLIFQGPDQYGWSERFWINSSLVGSALANEVLALVTGRAAILTDTCTIIRARIQSSQRRNPIVLTFNFGAGTPGTETSPTAESEVALLVSFQAFGTGFTRPFCRGIPSRVVNGDTFAPDATFMANLNSFFTVVTDGNWFVNGFLGSSPAPFPCAQLNPNLPRGFTVTLPGAVPGGVAPGSVLRFHRASIPGYNGLKTVINVIPAVGAVAGQLIMGGAAPAAAESPTNAFFTLETLSNAPITAAQPLKISRRGAARPFGLIRGRRQTLYSLRR